MFSYYIHLYNVLKLRFSLNHTRYSSFNFPDYNRISDIYFNLIIPFHISDKYIRNNQLHFLLLQSLK